MDFVAACLDEVALEGLDGITLSALWLRLKMRVPSFPLPLDEHSCHFLWSGVLATQAELEFYALPNERKVLDLHDRFDTVMEEVGICLEQELHEDIYPIVEVGDPTGQVMGSCSSYDSRKRVTPQIRSVDLIPQMTLSEAVERWGEKLVIVASQHLRSQAICGIEKANVASQLTAKAYIMLERIARSRRHGEVTHGNNSLKCLGVNAKTLFYQRKKLEKKGLITTQIFNSRTLAGQNMAGRLMHIPRFYVKRELRYTVYQKLLYDILSVRPEKRMVLADLRREMNVTESAFKHFQRAVQQYKMMESVLMKKSEIYPDKDHGTSKNGKPRGDHLVRVVRLLPSYDPNRESEDSDCEDDEVEDCVFHEGVVMEKSLIVQVYELLLQMGGDGILQSDVNRTFGLSRLDSRSVMRYLERLDLCQTVLHDQGKQRVFKYVANEVMGDCQVIQTLAKEKKRAVEESLKEENLDTSVMEQDTSQAVVDDTQDTSVQTPDIATMKSSLSTLCDIAPEYIEQLKKQGGSVTYRWLKRANIILETVNQEKMIDGVVGLRRKIMSVEEQEGLKTRVDRKSIFRILNRLEESGHIKVIRSNIEVTEDSVKQMELYCQKDIDESAPVVTSYLENETQKLRALKEMKSKVLNKSKGGSDQFCTVPRDSAKLNYALLTSKTLPEEMHLSPKAASAYGFKPKMRRAEILHKFLWYIIYGYDSALCDNTTFTDREMDFSSYPPHDGQLPTKSENPMPDSVLSSFKVYKDEIGWRRFIPPLPPHRGFTSGWFQTGDIILVMPVAIFLALVRITYQIPGLLEILRDPIRRHVTVSQLPSAIRQAIMFNRHYLFRVSAQLQQLCYMGLLSFGGREYREKHQIYCYLHQNASILNTTSESRDWLQFDFRTYEQVTDYWYQLQYTAINTPLSEISLTESTELKVISRVNQRFKECLRPVEPGSESDVGVIPGDGGGACGMDSSQFIHLRRNWYWAYDTDVIMNAMVETKQRRVESNRKTGTQGKVEKVTPPTGTRACVGTTSLPKRKRKRKRKSSVKTSDKTEEFEKVKVTGEDAIPKKGGKGVKRKAKEEIKSIVKTVKRPKEKHQHYRKKVYRTDSRGKIVALRGYDKVDEKILEERLRDRVTWSDEEDSLLLMCVVTQRVLTYPRKRRDIVISYFTLRDLLHDLSPRFKNKSSKSIQRRINYIMKNKETHSNTEVFVGEAMHDEAILAKVKNTVYTRAMPQEDMEKVFREVYGLLRKRFSAFSVSPAPIPLPGSFSEIEGEYEISGVLPAPVRKFAEVSDNTDICFWVLHNTIHCAMLLSDRTGRAHELFQLFNQYPEDLLQRVFNCMKTDGLITKFKSFHSTSRMLPWNKISLGNPGLGGYQVSQRYMYNWFAKHYPRNVFESTSNCLNEFLSNPEEEREMEEKGGFTAFTVALMALRQIRFKTTIPENVISMLPRLEKQQQKKGTSETLDPDDAEEDALIEEAARTRSQAKEGVESEGVSTEPCALTESRIDFQDVQKSTSRLVVNLMHQTYYGFAAVSNYNPDNLLVVHECCISVQVKSETIKQHEDSAGKFHKDMERRVQKYLRDFNHTSPFLHPKTAQEIMKHIRHTYPREVDLEALIQDCQSVYGYTAPQVAELRYIHDVVKETGSLGLPENSVLKFAAEMERFEDHMTLLQEHRMVSRLD